MSDTLNAAAKAAGLRDFELLKIAEGSTDQTKIASLLQRFPGAFDVRRLSKQDYNKALHSLMQGNEAARRVRLHAHVEAENAKGSVRDLSNAEYKRRLADYLGGVR